MLLDCEHQQLWGGLIPRDGLDPCRAASHSSSHQLTRNADHAVGVPLQHRDTAGTPWAGLALLCHSPRSLHGLKEGWKRETSEDGAWMGAWSCPQSLKFEPWASPPLSFRLVVTQVVF